MFQRPLGPGPNQVESGGFRFGSYFSLSGRRQTVKLSQMEKIGLLKCEIPAGRKGLRAYKVSRQSAFYQNQNELALLLCKWKQKAFSSVDKQKQKLGTGYGFAGNIRD